MAKGKTFYSFFNSTFSVTLKLDVCDRNKRVFVLGRMSRLFEFYFWRSCQLIRPLLTLLLTIFFNLFEVSRRVSEQAPKPRPSSLGFSRHRFNQGVLRFDGLQERDRHLLQALDPGLTQPLFFSNNADNPLNVGQINFGG